MDFILGFFFFSLGAIVGSFLNVVVMRLHTGVSALSGRSMCFSCGKTLTIIDLIPILSFLFLRGKCRNCSAKLSLQYPIVETITGLSFLGLFLLLPFSPFSSAFIIPFIFFAVISTLFIVIASYDALHKIIPDSFVYTLIAFSAASLFISFGETVSFVKPSLLDILAGFLVPLPIALLFFGSRGTWIGFGDAKLFVAIGWLFGFVLGYSVFVLSFWIGGLYGLISILLKRFSLKSEIAFGPFIVLAAFMVLFFSVDVTGLSLFLDKKELFGVQ